MHDFAWIFKKNSGIFSKEVAKLQLQPFTIFQNDIPEKYMSCFGQGFLLPGHKGTDPPDKITV